MESSHSQAVIHKLFWAYYDSQAALLLSFTGCPIIIRRLFEHETAVLLHDLHTIPRNNTLKKVTDLNHVIKKVTDLNHVIKEANDLNKCD